MKILAINSSHRGRRGCTQLLLDKMAEGAISAGAEFETVALAEKKINNCLACDHCGQLENLGHCVYETVDDVKAIFDKMRASDIIVYGLPVYGLGITGMMKTFMDRINSTATAKGICLTKSGLLFHHFDRQIIGKPLVILSLCANLEPETLKNSISYYQTFAKFMDAPVVGVLSRKMSMVLENQDNPLVRQVLTAYVQAGKELALQGKISRRTIKKADRPLLDIPFLDFWMNFRLFKQKAIEKANSGLLF